MFADRITRPHLALLSEQETAALDAIASVVIMRLERERRASTSGATPLLIQVDGPGSRDLVEQVAYYLQLPVAGTDRNASDSDSVPGPHDVDRPEQAWTVIRFDAWQYQRVAPPWWWLISALDGQLHRQFRECGAALLARKRLRDYSWRIGQFLRDLVPVMPLVLAALMLWFVSGQLAVGEFLKWAAGLIGGLATIAAFLWSGTNAVRRLLLGSPASEKATTRTRDPMADLQQRYSFLIRSSDWPLVMVIDNLDRCRADYVVELLEGLQTLLKNPDTERDRTRLVAVLVPAERDWLCDSYLQVYNEFQHAMRQPGRPFGLGFVDRVFGLSLHLPPPAPTDQRAAAPQAALDELGRAWSELEIRRLVAGAERRYGGGRPISELRLAAVRRLGKLELASSGEHRLDTESGLQELVNAMAPGPSVTNQLHAAYCVERTTQLLGGRAIDDDQDAIRRLGLWTILSLRWPLLAQELARRPEHVELLQEHAAPDGVSDDIEQVFTDPEVARLTSESPGLSPDTVRRFTSRMGEDRHPQALTPAPAGVALA